MADSLPHSSSPPGADGLADFEESYRSMFERMPYPMWVFDVETLQFLAVNDAAVAHYGYSREEFLSMDLRDIRRPEEIAAMQAYAAGPAQGLGAGQEFRHIRKDGTLIHVLVSLNAVAYQGRPARLALINDITERVRAEQLLRRSEAHLRAIMEHASDAILVLDADARILEANHAAAVLFGRPWEELVGSNAEVLVDPQDLAREPLRLEYVLSGEVLRTERRIRRRDGSYRFVESSTQQLPDGRILAISRDVTERRQAEDTLRDSEQRFRQLAENIQEVFWISSTDKNQMLYVSPAFETVWGRPREDLLQNPDIWREAIHPRDRERVAAELPKQLTGEYDVEYRIVRPDGSIRWIRDRVFPVRDAEGRVYRIAGLAEDISKHKLVEEELLRAKEAAEEASRAKSEFLSRTSHELRTPLNAILGFAQILEMDLEQEENRDSVRQILTAGRHLLRLVDEVLDLSRMETGELSMSTEDVPVDDAVRAAVALIRPIAEQRGVAIHVQNATVAGLSVRGDAPRLQQVLLSLLSNAVKFNVERGSVVVASELLAEGRVCISVRDTGMGIPAAHLGRLFTPFHRAQAERLRIPGTGLGLALSRGLVEAMGGTLTVESTQGKGSTFSLVLPRGEDAGSVEAGEDGPAPSEGAHTVLCIEDHVANQRLIERVLERRPAVQLIPAMQGRLGLELARRHRPDLVLLDLELPDMSGEEVLLQLHAEPELREVPVVIVSADPSPAARRRMLAMGAHEHLTKPLDITRFLQVLDDCLNQAR